jgi:hypothetical protein
MGGPGSGGSNKVNAQTHRLRGTYKPHRHGRPAHEAGLRLAASPRGRRPPGWLLDGLGRPGRDFARQTFGEYDGWTRYRLEVVRLAALALDRADEARRRLASEGTVLTTSTGRGYAHPLVKVARQSAADFAMLVGKLRLDVQVTTTSEAEQREDRELAELLAIR